MWNIIYLGHEFTSEIDKVSVLSWKEHSITNLKKINLKKKTLKYFVFISSLVVKAPNLL